MNKSSKFVAALTLAVGAVTSAVTGSASAQTVDNWVSPFGQTWKNGTQELCWRNAFWTPATAIEGCDGAPARPAPVTQAPPVQTTQPATTPPAVTPVSPPPPVTPVATRVVFNADTFFDFDKATLKPEGRQLLDQVVTQVNTLTLETIIAVGHTDWTGTDAYNQKLSERRAESVKTYLVDKGIDANRIYTEGKGKTSPVAPNTTREGRAQNRRVEIEIVGTRTN